MEGVEAVSRFREDYYRRLFQDARRLDPIEWRDDRERNVFVLADSFELPHAVTPVVRSTDFVFQYQSRLIQSFLVCPDSPKRRYPLGLPPPLDVEHWIELEASNLPRGETKTFLKRDNIFRFASETKKQFGKWTIHLRLRTFADEVPASQFELFKAKVQEILPNTAVSILLPAGIAAPKGRRRGQSLAPASAPAEPLDGKKSGAGPAVDATEVTPHVLDANPAPALTSLAAAVQQIAPRAPMAPVKPSPPPMKEENIEPRAATDYVPVENEQTSAREEGLHSTGAPPAEPGTHALEAVGGFRGAS